MIYYVRHILTYILNYDCDDIISKIHSTHLPTVLLTALRILAVEVGLSFYFANSYWESSEQFLDDLEQCSLFPPVSLDQGIQRSDCEILL